MGEGVWKKMKEQVEEINYIEKEMIWGSFFFMIQNSPYVVIIFLKLKIY